MLTYEHPHNVSVSKEEGTNKQAECNRLAIQSVRALARLGGYLPEPDMTPDNPIVKVSFVNINFHS